jgi:hypothetical protein
MLSEKLRAAIARAVPKAGPRAVIVAMRDTLNIKHEGADPGHARANKRCSPKSSNTGRSSNEA